MAEFVTALPFVVIRFVICIRRGLWGASCPEIKFYSSNGRISLLLTTATLTQFLLTNNEQNEIWIYVFRTLDGPHKIVQV